jgi:hypothetical protein
MKTRVEKFLKWLRRLLRRERVTTYCPKCQKGTFVAVVRESGRSRSEYGTMYWWSGYGKCKAPGCGHKGEISDSSE